MKLHQSLNVAGTRVPLTSMTAALTQRTAGRAIVTTPTALPLHQLVSVELGYDTQRTWFTGFVESTESPAPDNHRAILREPAAILARPLSLSLLHPTLRQVLDNITALTGLIIVCIEADAVRQTANLTHAGTGYSLLAQLGTQFGISDYTWFSLPDGSLWLGSWADCHWASRPITLDNLLLKEGKAVSGVQLPMLPAIRPDCCVNGHRVRQLLFDGTKLTLQWQQAESPQRRELKQLFPELANQTHTALLGKVVAICEPVMPGHIQSAYRPGLGVDVQLLQPDGTDDIRVPVFKNVPLPGATGQGQGQFAFAQPGCIVELGFAFGHSYQPFVRTILGMGWSLPGINNGEYLCQYNEGFHRIDTGGSQQLHTDQQLEWDAQFLSQISDTQTEQTGNRTSTVEGDYQDDTLGQRTITANWMTLLGLSGTRIATEQTHELLAGNVKETIDGMRNTTANDILDTVKGLHKTVAKKHWAGSDGTNIYQLLLQLMSAVEMLATIAATHQHVSALPGQPTAPPVQAANFTEQSTKTAKLNSQLSPFI